MRSHVLLVLMGCLLLGSRRTVAPSAHPSGEATDPTDALVAVPSPPTREGHAQGAEVKGAILAKPMDSPGLWIDPPRIRMSKDEFLLLRVDQSPGDIEVQVYAPDGELILSQDTINKSYGPEDVPLLAEKAGVYRVEGKAGPEFTPRQYRYKILLRRHARPADWERWRAAEFYWKGKKANLPEDRIRLLGQAAQAFAGIRYWRGEADASFRLAAVLGGAGKPSLAAARLERARDLYRTIGDHAQLVVTLQHLAEEQRAQGDLLGNRRSLEEASRIAIETADYRVRATLLQGLAMNLVDAGEPEKALHPLEEGLAMLPMVEDRSTAAGIFNALGRAYLSLGAFEKAQEYHWAALGQLNIAKDPDVLAMTFHHLGDALREAGDPRGAIARYRWALRIWRRLGLSAQEGETFNNQSGAFLQIGDRKAALQSLNRSAVLLDRAEKPLDSAQALVNAAWVYADLRQPQLARSALEEGSRRLAGRKPRPMLAAFFHLTNARTLLQLHRLDEAASEASEGLRIVEERRNRIEREELRVSFSPEIQGYFDVAIQAAMEKHKEEPEGGWDRRAFQLSERARARSLLDSMEGEAVQPKIDVEAVQRELGDDTALLEIFLGEQASYLWEVTRNDFRTVSLPGRKILQPLASTVTAGIAGSDRLTDLTSLHRLAFRLSSRLLGPLGALPLQSRLVFIVPPELQSVPFSALPNPFQRLSRDSRSSWPNPLIQERSVSFVPSMAVLAAQRKGLADAPPFGTGIAAFVAPLYVRNGAPKLDKEEQLTCTDGRGPISIGKFGPLEAGPGELKVIKALAGRGAVQSWLGPDASVESVLQARLGPLRYLYFSAHGHLDSEDANRSAIVLSAFDAAGQPVQPCLFARDIASLSLSVDLVVVSSCRSGLGRPVRGEGVLGLGQAFLKAGARRVGLTLWDVQEGPTASLMEAFHRRWLLESRSPAEALREAQLELWAEPATSSPAFWGGVFLLGDWQ